MKNRYEDPTQKLHSHGWSQEYKENHANIFGVRFRLYFKDGTQELVRYKDEEEALKDIHNKGDTLTGYIEL